MRRLILLNIFIFALLPIWADTLVGRVTDGHEPMSYVTVYLKDSPEVGTISDMEGVFTLPDLKRNTTIVLSFIGYKTMELKFNKIPKDTLDITMVEQPILLTFT